MKYLYLIIRHLFPKKPISRWKIINTIDVYEPDFITGNIMNIPSSRKYVLQDQFGNIKTESTKIKL